MTTTADATSTPLPELTLKLISEIIIPPERQREKAEADETLVNSIARSGLLNPIIIKADGTLVAGERRLDAHRKLNRAFIPVRIFEELPPIEAFLIELTENLARKQLTWQEECRAVHRYHLMQLEQFSGWTQHGTASDLGLSPAWVSKLIVVAEEMAVEGDDGEVAGCTTHSGAYNLIINRAARAKAAAQSRGLIAIDSIDARLTSATATPEEKTAALLERLANPEPVTEPKSLIEEGREAKRLLEAAREEPDPTFRDERIINTDFIQWAADYNGPAFDVIHCDFPYGKDYKGSNTRKTGKASATPLYNDSADIYWELLRNFFLHQDRFATDRCHCIFWFDMMHYHETILAFEEAGWKLAQPYPLIWDKGHVGVASDPQRRPRHCYETALLFSRGDRRIVNLTNDIGAAPLEEGPKLHISQKPVAILKKWLSLVVDEHTAVLDPTCGSGSALIAALAVGAERVLGLELDTSNADVATALLKRKEAQQ